MTKKVAVGSLKGGVGKTTVAVNLACVLAGTVSTVVLVDLDAQNTATERLEAVPPPIAGRLPPPQKLDRPNKLATVILTQPRCHTPGTRSASTRSLWSFSLNLLRDR